MVYIAERGYTDIKLNRHVDKGANLEEEYKKEGIVLSEERIKYLVEERKIYKTVETINEEDIKEITEVDKVPEEEKGVDEVVTTPEEIKEEQLEDNKEEELEKEVTEDNKEAEPEKEVTKEKIKNDTKANKKNTTKNDEK